MSCTTAVMLQDRLNDIERNIYDGIDFRQELNEAYALADELEDENAKLIVKLNAEHIVRQNVEAENARLRELVARMAEALGIDCEWADPNWCKSPCVLEFGCWPESDHAEIRCPAWATMSELGVDER